MALSVLNNIPSLVAQNQLEVTNNNLQQTLFQLSSGSRINSGADDPAGLSIINGLQANISALTQSSQNATDGVGQLQVADGALSQVTTLLNRAVTLATEAANGGLTPDQFSAITNEYGSIVSEINRIGNATNFNGTSVFSASTQANPNQVVSSAASNLNVNDALTAGTTTTVQLGNNPAYTFTAGASADTLLGTAPVTTNTTIGNGQTINITNSAGTVAFTAGPQSYTGATVMTGGEAAALNGTVADGLTVVNAKGNITTYAGVAGAQTVGAWLTAFNNAGAANGVSASLNATNHLVIQSTTGISSVSTAGDFTTDFGALAAPTITEQYAGATAINGGLTGTITGADSLSVTNANGVATYAGTSGETVQAFINGFNAQGNPLGMTASLNSSGDLQVTSTAPITAAPTVNGAFTTDFGAMTGTTTTGTDTVVDLMNQINSSGYGLTASINANGNFQVTSSKGAVTVTNDNANSLGTVAATNTIQDLINGINSSGLGVTASLASVSNPNELVSANTVTGGEAITAGGTLTLNSGTETNGTYAHTFTYTATAGVSGSDADPVAGTQGNNTVQGLIDAINNSGTSFNAYLNSNGKLEITDGSYSGNLATTGGLAGAGNPGAFASAGSITQLEITDPNKGGDLSVTNNDALLGFVAPTNGKALEGGNADSFVAPQQTGSGGASVFISDGDVTNPLYNTITVQVGLLNASQIGSNVTTLSSQNLGTATGAASALTVINGAISDVAAVRGTIGAGINRLTSATNVINTQVQNLTNAQSSEQDANIGSVVANLSKYQVLEQTGISALAQANQNEQAVLKLLQ
jgi:flagellin